MSRTDGHEPWKVRELHGEEFTMFETKNVWRGMDYHDRKWWHSKRAKAKRDLRAGCEPEPARTRSQSKWMFW